MSKLYSSKSKFSSHGFTLIELLVVIGIIAVLAGTVLVAINPGRMFAEARNARRWSEVIAILNAVLTYAVDRGGTLPDGIDTTLRQIGTDTTGCNEPAGACPNMAPACLNLTPALVDTYLGTIPFDPKTGTAAKTRYAIQRTAGGRVKVVACDAELRATIEVIR